MQCQRSLNCDDELKLAFLKLNYQNPPPLYVDPHLTLSSLYPHYALSLSPVCPQSVPSLSSFRSHSAPSFRPTFAPPIPDMPPRAGPLSEVGESSKRTRHDPRALYAIRPDNIV